MKQDSENRKQSSEYSAEFRNKVENSRGITLIALIITIIVMLILVAVTVSVVVNSGLFGHAQNASESWKQAQEQEKNIANGEFNITIGNKTYSSVDDFSENSPLTNPELDRRNIKVGDYVNYTPTPVSEAYSLTSAVSGHTSDQTIPQESLKWRVMNINEDGSVELISEVPTTTQITFKGALGVNNGVLVLNDLCKKQYSNKDLGFTARSINLIDIEKHFTSEGIEARDTYVSQWERKCAIWKNKRIYRR